MSQQDILRIQLKVIPGATRTGIEWYGDKLKIKVNVAPEKGRANAAVATLLAAKLGIAVSAITIVSGQSSPLKTVEIRGISLAQLQHTIA